MMGNDLGLMSSATAQLGDTSTAVGRLRPVIADGSSAWPHPLTHNTSATSSLTVRQTLTQILTTMKVALLGLMVQPCTPAVAEPRVLVQLRRGQCPPQQPPLPTQSCLRSQVALIPSHRLPSMVSALPRGGVRTCVSGSGGSCTLAAGTCRTAVSNSACLQHTYLSAMLRLY